MRVIKETSGLPREKKKNLERENSRERESVRKKERREIDVLGKKRKKRGGGRMGFILNQNQGKFGTFLIPFYKVIFLSLFTPIDYWWKNKYISLRKLEIIAIDDFKT